MNDEELAYGLRSIAAPIHSHSGEVIAALNLAVHRTMVSMDELIARYGPAVIADGARHLARHGAQVGAGLMSPTGNDHGVLWTPPPDVRETTEIGRYLAWLEHERGLAFPGYDELQRWSVDDLPAFWSSIWEFFEVKAHAPYSTVLASDAMPGATWFPGARLNFAEHLVGSDDDADRVAIVSRSQTRDPIELTFAELREQVARARAGLARLGVGPGDRVAAYMPNIPETLVGFAATASLGAIWVSCAPELGARSVVDRLAQLDPVVLLAVGGYGFRDRSIDRREEVATIRAALPTLRHVVHVPYGEHMVPDALSWDDLLAEPGPLEFAPGRLRPPAVRALLVRDDRPAEGDRPRARRHPARAPQGARASAGT